MGLYIGDTKYKIMSGSDKCDFAIHTKPYDAEIEYLAGASGAYINTEFVPTQNNFRLITQAYKNSTGDHMLLYVYNSESSNYFNLNWYATTVYFRYLGTQKTSSAAYGTHTFQMGSPCKVDNTNVNITGTKSFVGNVEPLHLFAIVKPNSKSAYFRGRFYYMKGYYGDTLVLDYIPVRIGQVGYIYDKVSGKLMGNAGTGTFGLGNDIN